METTKSVIVVYDKPQKKNAYLLCHIISKKNSAVKASQMTYEVYEANVEKSSSRNYYIFLGSNEALELIADKVENWTKEQGVRVGYDYHKGFIQIYDKPTSVKELNLRIKTVSAKIIGWYSLIAILFGGIGIALMIIARLIIKSQKMKSDIIKLQYALGVTLFVEKYLDDFLAN